MRLAGAGRSEVSGVQKGAKGPWELLSARATQQGGSCGAVGHGSMLAMARLQRRRRRSDGERHFSLYRGL
jgi:hypothetical protein